MNQDNRIESIRDPFLTPPKKKGCGCLSLFIGAFVIIIALVLAVQFMFTRTAIPLRVVASLLAKAEPDPIIMTGISGSSASGYRVARIESGENFFEDVRFHTTGIFRMIRENELIIHEIHVGKARVTTEFIASESESRSHSGGGDSATQDGSKFYFQMDRLSLNDIIITDSLTNTTVSIPKLHWTGLKTGKGQFDLGDIHVESNMLTVRTTNLSAGRHRIEAAILPDIHELLLKPITIVADIQHVNGDRFSSDIQAFDGALRITDDADRNGKIVIQGLDLADYIDGPLPREIQLDVEMRPVGFSADEREHHILSGSFRLGKVPFTIETTDLTESSAQSDDVEVVATATHGETEFRYAFAPSGAANEMVSKPLLTSKPPMEAEAMLSWIFHDAEVSDLDADTRSKLTKMAEWFRFSEEE